MQYLTDTYGGFRVAIRDEETHELVTELPSFDQRTIVLAHPYDRSVVLGSMQELTDDQQLRCRAAGFGLHRRRSGGGAVVIDPSETIWIDLFLPTTDVLYVRDVREGSFWVGDLWQEALRSLGYSGAAGPELVVHRGAVVETDWSKQCCFAGLGPGELLNGDHKVMGLSQRRERAGAWFFTLAYRALDPARDAHLLAPSFVDESALAEDLASHVGVVRYSHDEVEQAILTALTSLPS